MRSATQTGLRDDDQVHSKLRIAYLGTYYPSSICPAGMRTEIEEMRSRGIDVAEFSFRVPPRDMLLDEAAIAPFTRTHYLFRSYLQMLAAGLLGLSGSWSRIRRAVRVIVDTGPTGLTARVRQAAYLLQGASLARQLQRRRIQHLHVHGGENSIFVGAIASAISSVPSAT